MPKAELDFYDRNFSPISAADYVVLIGNQPELGPMVTNLTLPATSVNRYRMELMGKSRAFPGRRISSSNEVNMTFLLNRRTQTYQRLITLRESFSESETGNIVGETFTIRAIVYDETGLEVMIVKFHDCWLAEVGDVNLEANAESQLLECPCVFCYSFTSYDFIGIGNENGEIATSLSSRLATEPLNVGSSTDRYGSFPALNFSKQLPGSNPMEMIDEKRSALANYIGLSLDDVLSMGSVINSVRSAASNAESKYSRIRMAAETHDYNSVLNNIKRLSGIRSLF